MGELRGSRGWGQETVIIPRGLLPKIAVTSLWLEGSRLNTLLPNTVSWKF